MTATVTSHDVQASFLIHDLVSRTTSAVGASNTRFAVARLTSLLKLRIRERDPLVTSPEQASVKFWTNIIVAAMEEREVFAFARLPELIRDVRDAIIGSEGMTSESFQSSLLAALDTSRPSHSRGDAMEVDGNSKYDSLLAGFVRYGLATGTADPFVSAGAIKLHLDSNDNTAVILQTLSRINAHPREASSAILDAFSRWSSTCDLTALSRHCGVLIDQPDILESMFLFVEPKELLRPLRSAVESFVISGDNFGEGQLIEKFGGVIIFIQIVAARFSLDDSLSHHLATSSGFLRNFLPSISAVFALPGLSSEATAAVNGWIGALFGNGISDELIQSTDPRTLLLVAPTIVQQSLLACELGVLDPETLKEGLSYFLQDLLAFTLPGVIGWLVAQIQRIGPSNARTLSIDILNLFTTSPSIPASILELVVHDLESVKDLIDKPETSKFATGREKKSAAVIITSSSWSEYFMARLSSLVGATAASSTRSLSNDVERGLEQLMESVGREKVVEIILESLLAASLLPASDPTMAEQDERERESTMVIEIGSSLFTTPTLSSSTSTVSFPLLESLLGDHFARILESMSNGISEGGKEKVEMVGKVMRKSIVVARGIELEFDHKKEQRLVGARYDTDVMIEQVCAMIKKVRRTKEVSKGIDEFVGRFVEDLDLVTMCPSIMELK